MPIPLFLFRDVCYELARVEWEDPEMPAFQALDEGRLLASLAQPYQRVGGELLYPSIRAMAACLFRGLIKNHPLVDGNKRAAVTTLVTFLRLNGWRMTASNDQMRDYALRVARRKGAYRFAPSRAGSGGTRCSWLLRNSPASGVETKGSTEPETRLPTGSTPR